MYKLMRHMAKSMQSHTIRAIALRPAGNEQDGFYFYNLSTGEIYQMKSLIECIHSQNLTKLVKAIYMVKESTFLKPTCVVRNCRNGVQKCRMQKISKTC